MTINHSHPGVLLDPVSRVRRGAEQGSVLHASSSWARVHLGRPSEWEGIQSSARFSSGLSQHRFTQGFLSGLGKLLPLGAKGSSASGLPVPGHCCACHPRPWPAGIPSGGRKRTARVETNLPGQAAGEERFCLPIASTLLEGEGQRQTA